MILEIEWKEPQNPNCPSLNSWRVHSWMVTASNNTTETNIDKVLNYENISEMKLLMLSIFLVTSGQSQLTEQEEKLQLMLRSLVQPEPGVGMTDQRLEQRMDPLLRVLMVSALQRGRDERDKNNLSLGRISLAQISDNRS